MRSETSSFSRGIFLNSLKNQGWVGVIYLLMLLVAVPLNILMMYTSSSRIPMSIHAIERLFFREEIQRLAIIVIPVLLAILLFRYLQEKNAAVMMHSLPVTRKATFRSKVLAGMLTLITPVLVTGVVTWLLRWGLGLQEFISGEHLWKWVGLTIVLGLFMFLATVLMGMFTGMSTAQGALTYIGLFLPAGLSLLILSNLEYFIYGFMRDFTAAGKIENFSPLLRFLEMNFGEVKMAEVVIYLVLGLIFYLLAGYLYQRRQVEAASQTIAFFGFKPVFKYGVTFCLMLVGGLYFEQTQSQPGWMYFGYLTGSLAGYVIAEMVLRKAVRIWPNLKGYLVFAGIIVILFGAVKMDIFGFEQKLPELQEVKSIYYWYGYYGVDKETLQANTYVEAATLETLRSLHQQIIMDKSKLQGMVNNGRSTQQIMLVYQLKNGEKIVRGYTIPTEDYKQNLKAIFESKEYKTKHYPQLRVNADQVQKLVVGSNEIGKKATIVDPQHIKEALAALRQDAEAVTYEEMNDRRPPWAEITMFLGSDKTLNETWNRNYRHFEQWLKERGYYQDARVLPSDISYMTVEKINREPVPMNETSTTDSVKAERYEERNPERIAEFLENCYRQSGEEDYIVNFFSQNGQVIFNGAFSEGNAPSYIKDYFKK